MPTGRRQSRWLFKKRGEIDFGTIKEKPFSGSNPGPLAGYKSSVLTTWSYSPTLGS